MKIKSLIAAINKDIEETSKRKVTLLDEITRTKAQLAEVTSQIQNYDSSDMDGFKELRDKQAFYEHTLEMLNRKISESKSLDDASIREYISSFRTERTEIIRKASKEVFPLVERLDSIQSEASAELLELKRAFDLWCNTYNVPSQFKDQGNMFGYDETNMIGNIQNFIRLMNNRMN